MLYLDFFLSLFLTVIIEGFLIFLIYRRKDYIEYSVWINLFTNPSMNLFANFAAHLTGFSYIRAVYILEILLIPLEAMIYVKLSSMKIRDAMILSAVVNSASFGIGMLIW